MAKKLVEYIKSEKGNPETWLPKKLGAPASQKMRPATHIGKYTHPDVDKSISIQVFGSHAPKGYLCSGNFTTEIHDYAGSAAFLPYAKTMEAEMEDGRPVREHLQEGSHPLKSISKADDQTLHAWQNVWEEQQEQSKVCGATDRRLKQVYFPLGDDQYRLLSLLPCAILIWELKARLNKRQWQEKSDLGGKSIRKAFFNQCQSEYGGTKPWNVSFLNSENGGSAVKLTCTPPAMSRKYTLPTRNFFNLIRPYRSRRPTGGQTHLWELLEALYQTLAFDPNTDWARRKKRGILCAIIEHGVILPAENIRENAPPGWSADDKYSALPQEQKDWLDPGRGRDTDAESGHKDWQKAVSGRIATFITTNLEKMMKFDPAKKAIVVDDAFVNEISDLAREYLNG